MTTLLTWEQFVEKYEPEFAPPYYDEEHGHMYDTYGEDYEKIKKADPLHVWTIVDGDDGNLCILNGWHWVNRFGYIITKNPFNENEYIEAEY